MVTINGTRFYEQPTSCGTCPFFHNGTTSAPISAHYDKGICRQWDEMHHSWCNIPRRCQKLFKAAFEQWNDTGIDLVITKKE